MLTFDLTQFPEFQHLQQQCQQLAEQLREVQAQLPQWVDEVEAQRITGLSRTTMFRERQRPHSLIRWKQDHGVRYERASLIAHNHSRAVVRGASPLPH